jgi:hypothetical protein
MAGDIHGITNFSHLSLAGNLGVSSDLSLSGGSVSVTSLGRVALGSGTSFVASSGATIAYLPGVHWSMGTLGTAASLASVAGLGFQLGIFFGASGCSLIGRSGNTIYTIGASAVSAAAP